MSLTQWEPRRKSVRLPDSDLTMELRGLGTDDLTYLIEIHKEDIVSVASHWLKQKQAVFSSRGLQQITLTLLTKFPDLVAEIISVAADERKAVAKARVLPFSTQMTALNSILEMTFDDAGGLKNLFATLQKIIEEALPDDVKEAVVESLKALKIASRPTTSPVEPTRTS